MKVVEIYEIRAEISGKEINLVTGVRYKVETAGLVLKDARLTSINLKFLSFEIEGLDEEIKIKIDTIQYID